VATIRNKTDPTMLRFLLTRLSLIIPTFFGMTLVAFFLIRLVPGDPIETLAGERGIDPAAPRRTAQGIRPGPPDPRAVRHLHRRVLAGRSGQIHHHPDPVLTSSWRCFRPPSSWRSCAILFALLIGIPAGIIAAVKRNSILDHGVMGISLTGYSMPIFWWGLLLILLFSVQLDLTPVSGRIRRAVFHRTGHRLPADRHAGWPAKRAPSGLPLAPDPADHRAGHQPAGRHRAHDPLGHAGGAGRGLHPHRPRQGSVQPFAWWLVHALRNALIPVVTVIGLQVGVLFTGAILTETIFSWPGVGKWLIEAISRRDYPVLQGGMLLLGAWSWLVNLLVDVTYGIINPAHRHQR
jgi:dipeptide transport system permease protein